MNQAFAHILIGAHACILLRGQKKHLRIEPLHAGFENASKYKFCIMKLDIHLSACPSLIGGQARILVRGQKTKQKHLGIAPLPAGFCECKQILVLCNELMRGPKCVPTF